MLFLRGRDAGTESRDIAICRDGASLLRETAGQGDAGSRVLPAGRSQGVKTPENSSAGPDFLGFALIFDTILKKHMFFDKKYILFSPH